MDCSLPGFSVHGIFQARVLEWVAIAFSRGSSQPRDQTHISYISSIGRWVLYPQGHHRIPNTYILYVKVKVKSCATLCDPMDCSLPGSSVHGIFQAIVLEWIAISFSKGYSQPRDQTWVSPIAGRVFTI